MEILRLWARSGSLAACPLGWKATTEPCWNGSYSQRLPWDTHFPPPPFKGVSLEQWCHRKTIQTEALLTFSGELHDASGGNDAFAPTHSIHSYPIPCCLFLCIYSGCTVSYRRHGDKQCQIDGWAPFAWMEGAESDPLLLKYFYLNVCNPIDFRGPEPE